MPAKKEQRTNRQRIVDAAWELLWQRGYHASSVADIARLAGVPKGSVYNYFDSKEELAAHCLSRIRYQTETHLRLEVLEGTLAPGDIVKRLLDHYEELFSRFDFGRGDPLSSRLNELADTHPELVARLLPVQAVWHEVVTQKLWAYATVARIPALVEAADHLAALIYAALQGILLQMKVSHSPQPLKAARHTLVAMVNAYVSALATGEVRS